ncbi:MAG: hypothetical protein R3Y67_07165 [Eubacteriales bacterium]
MVEQSKKKQDIIFMIISTLGVFLIMIPFFSCMVSADITITDMPTHVLAALDVRSVFLASFEVGIQEAFQNRVYVQMWNYPIWHITYAVLYSCIQDSALALGVTNAMYIAIAYLISLLVLRKYLAGYCATYLINLLALSMVVIGPLYFPWFSYEYFLGQFSTNVWHNPTILAVKPFGIVIFFLYYELIKQLDEGVSIRKSYKKIAVISILLLVSVFAKPNFFQVFVPSVIVYFLLRVISDFKKNKHLLIILAIFLAATAGVVQAQYASAIEGARGGIGIELFKVWSAHSTFWPGSFLISITFPLIVLIFNRQLKGMMVLAWLLFASAVSQYSIFYLVNGWRTADFSWGVHLATGILFLVSIIQFIKKEHKSKLYCWLGSLTLFAHIACGFIYWSGTYIEKSYKIPLFWFLVGIFD